MLPRLSTILCGKKIKIDGDPCGIKFCNGIKAEHSSPGRRQADRSGYPAEGDVSELCGGVATNSRN